jgi:hypothetical protein
VCGARREGPLHTAGVWVVVVVVVVVVGGGGVIVVVLVGGGGVRVVGVGVRVVVGVKVLKEPDSSYSR